MSSVVSSTTSPICFKAFLQTATLQDVVKFQQQWVKGRTYHFAILGDKKHLDMKALKQMGEVIELTTEDIFGY